MTIPFARRQALLDAYRPALVPLGESLIAAVFPLMKILPAYESLRGAEASGAITRRSTIVETSSGTMALALAIVCRWLGYRLVVVGDSSCDGLVHMRLRELGAHVEIVSAPAARGGFQRARLDRVESILAQVQGSWWVNQYGNDANACAYRRVATQLVESLGRVDCLVGPVGSGGSMCGTARYLRALFPQMHLVGVDTFGSVLFGQPERPRLLRGLGNSILPCNLDHRAFDEVHWVTAAESFAATRALYSATGLFRGGTSGAAWMVARHWALSHPGAQTVCFMPDDGYRYLHSIYDDQYLQEHELQLKALPQHPCESACPTSAGPSWSWVDWARRSLADVVGAPLAVPADVQVSLQV